VKQVLLFIQISFFAATKLELKFCFFVFAAQFLHLKILVWMLVNNKIQAPSGNQIVRYSNGHFPDTICVWFLNGKIDHLVNNKIILLNEKIQC
jgi:hypothetical protein